MLPQNRITVFQFTGIALGAAAIHKKELRTGVVGLFAVLTASTFIYTADVFSAPKTGLFSLTHDKDLKIVVPNSDSNPAMYAYYKGLGASACAPAASRVVTVWGAESCRGPGQADDLR